MRDHSSTFDNLRFWGPTTFAGSLAATGVVLIMTTVASAPAHSRPAPVQAPPVSIDANTDAPTQNCFMGQHDWNISVGPLSQCTVAERTATHSQG